MWAALRRIFSNVHCPTLNVSKQLATKPEGTLHSLVEHLDSGQTVRRNNEPSLLKRYTSHLNSKVRNDDACRIMGMLVSSIKTEQLPRLSAPVMQSLLEIIPNSKPQHIEALARTAVPRLFQLMLMYLNDMEKDEACVKDNVQAVCQMLNYVLSLNRLSVHKTALESAESKQLVLTVLKQILRRRRNIVPKYLSFLVKQLCYHVGNSLIQLDDESLQALGVFADEYVQNGYVHLTAYHNVKMLSGLFGEINLPLPSDTCALSSLILFSLKRGDRSEALWHATSILLESAVVLLKMGPSKVYRPQALILTWSQLFANQDVTLSRHCLLACAFLRLCLAFDREDLFRRNRPLFQNSVAQNAYDLQRLTQQQKDEIKFMLCKSAARQGKNNLPKLFDENFVKEMSELLYLDSESNSECRPYRGDYDR